MWIYKLSGILLVNCGVIMRLIVKCSLIIAMSLNLMRKKPDILGTRTVAQSELFRIEQVDLRFENGESRCYEPVSYTHLDVYKRQG